MLWVVPLAKPQRRKKGTKSPTERKTNIFLTIRSQYQLLRISVRKYILYGLLYKCILFQDIPIIVRKFIGANSSDLKTKYIQLFKIGIKN